MKQIRISSIEMHYFKGIVSNRIEFGERTIIEGPNAAGKSTIVDAFYWCLWGKNAQGDQKFSVKTLDGNGVEIPNVNHEVTVVLMVNGTEQAFRRVLVPEYNSEGELKGNHADYFWNDVPMKQSEYKAKVDEVVSESVFRLITSPYAFLALDWKKQRETLMRLAGNVSDEDVEGYEQLKQELKTKTLEEIGKEVVARLKKVNEAMQDIPARIDEAQRNAPQAPDEARLTAEREALQQQIDALDKAEKDEAAAVNVKNARRTALVREIADLKFRQSSILNEAQAQERNAIHEANARYEEAERSKKTIELEDQSDSSNVSVQIGLTESAHRKAQERREQIEKELADMRDTWTMVRGEQFSADEYLKCPLYGHLCHDGEACAKYDQNQGEAYERWSKDQQDKLAKINEHGAMLKAQLEGAADEIEAAKASIAKVKEGFEARRKDRSGRLEECEQVMKQHPKKPLISTVKGEDIEEWVSTGLQIAAKEKQLADMEEARMTVDNGEAKRSLQAQINAINVELRAANLIAQAQKRVAQLGEELKAYGEQKVQLEYKREQCRDFEIAKMNLITDKVNGKFKIVRWQMFQRQVNGEEVPACICLCGGVPWYDANDAAKLNAGIDVAYTLALASNADVPVFIDGAERSTNIYSPGGQQIILKVAAIRELTVDIK